MQGWTRTRRRRGLRLALATALLGAGVLVGGASPAEAETVEIAPVCDRVGSTLEVCVAGAYDVLTSPDGSRSVRFEGVGSSNSVPGGVVVTATHRVCFTFFGACGEVDTVEFGCSWTGLQLGRLGSFGKTGCRAVGTLPLADSFAGFPLPSDGPGIVETVVVTWRAEGLGSQVTAPVTDLSTRLLGAFGVPTAPLKLPLIAEAEETIFL